MCERGLALYVRLIISGVKLAADLEQNSCGCVGGLCYPAEIAWDDTRSFDVF